MSGTEHHVRIESLNVTIEVDQGAGEEAFAIGGSLSGKFSDSRHKLAACAKRIGDALQIKMRRLPWS